MASVRGKHEHHGRETVGLRQQVHAGWTAVLLAFAFEEGILSSASWHRLLVQVQTGHVVDRDRIDAALHARGHPPRAPWSRRPAPEPRFPSGFREARSDSACGRAVRRRIPPPNKVPARRALRIPTPLDPRPFCHPAAAWLHCVGKQRRRRLRTHGELARNCFASSSVHWAICFVLQREPAAGIAAARRTGNQESFQDVHVISKPLLFEFTFSTRLGRQRREARNGAAASSGGQIESN